MRLLPPSTSKRMPDLDVLRGIAIALVLFIHAPIAFSQTSATGMVLTTIKNLGWSGVDLFFVLSGFLISGLLYREYQSTGRIKLGRFLLRRGLKIWPAYYFVMIGVMVCVTPVESLDGEAGLLFVKRLYWQLRAYWPYWLFVQNYIGMKGWEYTWSIAVEEHFYLTFAALLWLLCILCRRGRSVLERPWIPRITLVVCLAALVGRVATFLLLENRAYPDVIYKIHYVSHLRLDALLFGTYLGYLYHCRRPVLERLKPHVGWLFGVSLLLLLPLFIWPQRNSGTGLFFTLGFTLNYLGFGGILIACRLVEWSKYTGLVARIGSPACWALRALGIYSYTIYLTHGCYRELIPKAWHNAPGSDLQGNFGGVAIYLVYCVVSGVLLSHVIERPILYCRERLFSTKVKPGNRPASTQPIVALT